MTAITRRQFTKGLVVSVAGASLPGCLSTESGTNDPGQRYEIEDRVRFADLRWRPIGPDDVWGLRAELVNTSGEHLWVECILTVGEREYGEVFELEPWASMRIYLLTDIPDSDPMPTEFELAAYKSDPALLGDER